MAGPPERQRAALEALIRALDGFVADREHEAQREEGARRAALYRAASTARLTAAELSEIARLDGLAGADCRLAPSEDPGGDDSPDRGLRGAFLGCLDACPLGALRDMVVRAYLRLGPLLEAAEAGDGDGDAGESDPAEEDHELTNRPSDLEPARPSTPHTTEPRSLESRARLEPAAGPAPTLTGSSILVLVDDVEHVLLRKRRLAGLARALGSRLLVAPTRTMRRADATEVPLLTWVLRTLQCDVDQLPPPLTRRRGRVRAAAEIVKSTAVDLVLAPAPGDRSVRPRGHDLAAALQRRTGVPVLHFDVAPDEPGGKSPCFDRVIAACDPGRGERVATAAAEIADAVGCGVTMLEVLDGEALAEGPSRRRGFERLETTIRSARRQLGRRVDRLVRRAGARSADIVVRAGNLASELTRLATRFESPLVVLPGSTARMPPREVGRVIDRARPSILALPRDRGRPSSRRS